MTPEKKVANEVSRKQRWGNVPDFTTPKAPRMKKTIHCEYCGAALWVGKHPRPYRCPTCRVLVMPCDRCDDIDCAKEVCRFNDGEYSEEAIWVRRLI